MYKKLKPVIFALLLLVIITLLVSYVIRIDMPVLTPKGEVGLKQRDLLVISTLLMLVVVIPVFVLTFYIVWKYREKNHKATYAPDWAHSNLAEVIWWGVPFIIIIILGAMNWVSSHKLDPYRPLESDVKPITVQVVALDWKWLFIYPEEGVAAINFMQVPVDTPINFQITADAPMNSFWIPELGGQIFAMPGMKTELHLIANQMGSYRGVSANLSGKGFSGMTFTVKAATKDDFQAWVASVKNSGDPLNKESYRAIAKPSENNPVTLYTLKDDTLFDWIVMKDITPEMQGASR